DDRRSARARRASRSGDAPRFVRPPGAVRRRASGGSRARADAAQGETRAPRDAVTRPALFGIGTLATGTTAEVDAHGTVRQGPLRLGWRVRSEKGWLVPGRDRPVFRSRPHPAPVAHTALRVSGGSA